MTDTPKPDAERKMEPKLVHCGLRDCADEIHLECRFDDGQKFAAVIIDGQFPNLAQAIHAALSQPAPVADAESRIAKHCQEILNLAQGYSGTGVQISEHARAIIDLASMIAAAPATDSKEGNYHDINTQKQ